MSAATILCPIDFSEPSRAALTYASAMAEHFGAQLILLAVDDPLLAEAAASAGVVTSLADETRQELQRVADEVVGKPTVHAARLTLRVRTGKPAVEILDEARQTQADLIVMSSRGHIGARKMFFGSTTERVLRETSVPVLVTPTQPPPGTTLERLANHIGRVLAPVDLSDASPRQLSVAAGIAEALTIPLLITTVLEQVAIPQRVRHLMAGADATRRSHAEEKLDALAATLHASVKRETLILAGDPAEEIVKLAEARHAHLIVMGLHSSELFGPRMGSVTYRVLSLTRTLVLAIPPAHHRA